MNLNGNDTGWVLCAVHRLLRFHINDFFLSDQSWSVVCFECYKKVHYVYRGGSPSLQINLSFLRKGEFLEPKRWTVTLLYRLLSFSDLIQHASFLSLRC